MKARVAGIWGAALLAGHAAAAPLTPAEATVCRDARHCADIVRDHAPSEFDYAVLAGEFARLGPKAVRALSAVADTDGRRNLVLLAQMMEPEAALELGLTLVGGRDEKARELGLLILRDPVLQNRAPSGTRSAPRAALGRIIDAGLHPLAPKLLRGDDFADVADLWQRALASRNPELAGAAYQALFEQSPDGALQALKALAREADTPQDALAVARVLGDRAARIGDPVYARMLRGMGTDAALPPAMRDAALVEALGTDGDLPLGSARSELLVGAFDADPDRAVDAQHLRRHGPAVLRLWQALAEARPEAREAVLRAMEGVAPNTQTRLEVLRLALSAPYTSRDAVVALDAMEVSEVALLQSELQAVADRHPWPGVRWAAQRRLEFDPRSHVGPPWMVDSPDLRASRKLANYCERGTPVEREATVGQVPMAATDAARAAPTDAPLELTAISLRTAHPGASRWLLGYDRGESGGALVAWDYATGEADVLLEDNVRFIVPAVPAPLGRQPDRLLVIAGPPLGTQSESALWTVAPDGEASPRKLRDLPAPVEAVFRLDDGSLLLHFHGEDRAALSMPTPLILTPDGGLRPGCEGEALAGERPSLFRP